MDVDAATIIMEPEAPTEHVTIWNLIECRKIAGNAAPLRRNLDKYLQKHPECEVYDGQERLLEQNGITRQNEHVPMWHTTEKRKITGNAAPLSKNVGQYLTRHPDCEVYTGQDKLDRQVLPPQMLSYHTMAPHVGGHVNGMPMMLPASGVNLPSGASAMGMPPLYSMQQKYPAPPARANLAPSATQQEGDMGRLGRAPTTSGARAGAETGNDKPRAADLDSGMQPGGATSGSRQGFAQRAPTNIDAQRRQRANADSVTYHANGEVSNSPMMVSMSSFMPPKSASQPIPQSRNPYSTWANQCSWGTSGVLATSRDGLNTSREDLAAIIHGGTHVMTSTPSELGMQYGRSFDGHWNLEDEMEVINFSPSNFFRFGSTSPGAGILRSTHPGMQ